jgi:uncharacterized BrkB/YihY/UPF0761 family membrane protein
MQKPKHLVRGLFGHMDVHQKVFIWHTVILLILLCVLPIINLDVIESSTVGSGSIKFLSVTFWKSDFIVLAMIATIFLISFREKVRQMIVAAFGVSDVFINFVCYLVIVAAYIGVWDATMAVHLRLTQTIGLASWYYIIGIWLAIGLMLHASWSYKHGKQAHQATIINLATQKQSEQQHNHQESFKNLFD